MMLPHSCTPMFRSKMNERGVRLSHKVIYTILSQSDNICVWLFKYSGGKFIIKPRWPDRIKINFDSNFNNVTWNVEDWHYMQRHSINPLPIHLQACGSNRKPILWSSILSRIQIFSRHEFRCVILREIPQWKYEKCFWWEVCQKIKKKKNPWKFTSIFIIRLSVNIEYIWSLISFQISRFLSVIKNVLVKNPFSQLGILLWPATLFLSRMEFFKQGESIMHIYC